MLMLAISGANETNQKTQKKKNQLELCIKRSLNIEPFSSLPNSFYYNAKTLFEIHLDLSTFSKVKQSNSSSDIQHPRVLHNFILLYKA